MDPKQVRKAQQEALQVAGNIRKSGYPFYCAQLPECMGDLSTLIECLGLMNREADGKKRLGNTGAIGKLLISTSEDVLVGVLYMQNCSLNQKTAFLNDIDINKSESVDTETLSFTIENDPDNSVYVFKLKDNLIASANAKLRETGVIPKPDEDDDELFGEDVFEL